MTTSKPKQALPHALAHPHCTPDAADFKAVFTQPDIPHPPGGAIARVTAVDRDQYLIRNTEHEVPARLTGRFVHAADSLVALPCVGDWVEVTYHDADTHASILRILPRTSFLRRRRPGGNAAFQMIAANIDVAFIVQSCHFDFNVRRLERYLVMTADGHIEPVILLTKTDLISPAALAQLLATLREAGISARIIPLSHVSGQGVEEVRERIQPGKTYCLLGSSGVGKTTLVNCLAGRSALATGAVSHTGEGRHTTTRRQLIVLEQGGLLIDMPGMRELGMLDASDGIDASFSDVEAHAAQCRFTDCTHTSEPGCAVLRAIAEGALDAAHLQHYRKLKKESEFHGMSDPDKRKKDRAFGKHVRASIKAKGRWNDD